MSPDAVAIPLIILVGLPIVGALLASLSKRRKK